MVTRSFIFLNMDITFRKVRITTCFQASLAGAITTVRVAVFRAVGALAICDFPDTRLETPAVAHERTSLFGCVTDPMFRLTRSPVVIFQDSIFANCGW